MQIAFELSSCMAYREHELMQMQQPNDDGFDLKYSDTSNKL